MKRRIPMYVNDGFVKNHVSSTAHFPINLNGQINFFQTTQTAWNFTTFSEGYMLWPEKTFKTIFHHVYPHIYSHLTITQIVFFIIRLKYIFDGCKTWVYIRGYNLFIWKHLYSKVESNSETFMFSWVNQVLTM